MYKVAFSEFGTYHTVAITMDIKRHFIQSDDALQVTFNGSTPNGEYPTTNTCEVGEFILSKAFAKGKRSGFHSFK